MVSGPSWVLGFRVCFECGTYSEPLTHLCSPTFSTKSSSLWNFVMSAMLRLSSIETTSAFSIVVSLRSETRDQTTLSLFLFLSHPSSLSSGGRRVVAFPAAASRRLTTSVLAGTSCSMPSLVSLLKLPKFTTQTC